MESHSGGRKKTRLSQGRISVDGDGYGTKGGEPLSGGDATHGLSDASDIQMGLGARSNEEETCGNQEIGRKGAVSDGRGVSTGVRDWGWCRTSRFCAERWRMAGFSTFKGGGRRGVGGNTMMMGERTIGAEG